MAGGEGRANSFVIFPNDPSRRFPNGRGGWTWKKHPIQVLYHLPAEVLEASIIFVVEGERDAETLRGHGFCATTTAFGAKAPWLPEFTDALRGREVMGILELGGPGTKDVTDWFNAGHSELELIAQLDGSEVNQ